MADMSNVAPMAAAGTAISPGWGTVIGAVLGGLMGSGQQREQEKARKEQALINMYAPLFGNAPQPIGARQNMVMPGAISGAMGAYDIYSQIRKDDRDQLLNEYIKSQIPVKGGETAQGSTDVFIPYAAPAEPTQSVGAAEAGPYSYRPYNPFTATP